MDQLKDLEPKLVFVFDLCSSSRIADDLVLNSGLSKMKLFYRAMFKFLELRQARHSFEIYKYVGDGWILLFDPSITGIDLKDFTIQLCQNLKSLFEHYISQKLTQKYEKDELGITIGIEYGNLLCFKPNPNGPPEYMGRALNVASRLQGAVKEKKGVAFRALISKQVRDRYFKDIPKYSGVSVERKLRNIDGGGVFPCFKVNFQKEIGEISV